MDIRPAKSEDAQTLKAVVIAAYAPFRQSGLQLPAVEDGLADNIETCPSWVAVEDGKILGGIIADVDPNGVQIMNLAVDPDAGGRGVGRALMTCVEEWARAQGASNMVLTTHVDMTGTQTFYRRLGWHETGRAGNKFYMTKPVDDHENSGENS